MWIVEASAALQTLPSGAGGFSLLWSLIVPGLILACSVVLTWLLYRHFKKAG
jgi:hypothetical protein